MKREIPPSEQTPREENPFEDVETAKLWIRSVESEMDGPREKSIYPLVRKWLQNPSIHDVLDVGAGQGIAAPLAKGKRYVGLEPSQTLVDRAREKYPEFGSFIVGDAYQIPSSPDAFDGVFSINVWFHLATPERAAAEVARVLRPNGKFLIVNPNPAEYTTWESFYDDVIKDKKKLMGKVRIPSVTLPKSIFYMHSNEEIMEGLERAGLHTNESREFAPLPDNGVKLFRYYMGEVRK